MTYISPPLSLCKCVRWKIPAQNHQHTTWLLSCVCMRKRQRRPKTPDIKNIPEFRYWCAPEKWCLLNMTTDTGIGSTPPRSLARLMPFNGVLLLLISVCFFCVYFSFLTFTSTVYSFSSVNACVVCPEYEMKKLPEITNESLQKCIESLNRKQHWVQSRHRRRRTQTT